MSEVLTITVPSAATDAGSPIAAAPTITITSDATGALLLKKKRAAWT